MRQTIGDWVYKLAYALWLGTCLIAGGLIVIYVKGLPPAIGIVCCLLMANIVGQAQGFKNGRIAEQRLQEEKHKAWKRGKRNSIPRGIITGKIP